jgi:phospholipid-binding lipoprotein MlaA
MNEGLVKKVMGAWRLSSLAALSAVSIVAGCAVNDTGASEPWDPIEVPNRFVFSLNRAVDLIAIRPFAVLYRDWVPTPAQKGIHNLLDNLGEPVTAINEVVQGSPGRAGITLARFLVNSTIGLVGIFDVATSLGLPKTQEDMGKTIGMYAGVEPENGGFYLVLPVVGPSNARDATGLMIDFAVDPFQIAAAATYAGRAHDTIVAVSSARYGLRVLDARSRTLFALDDLEKNSVDYYAALKSAYTQNRAEAIREKKQATSSRGELDRRDKLALVR